jgi:hypothetical protein
VSLLQNLNRVCARRECDAVVLQLRDNMQVVLQERAWAFHVVLVLAVSAREQAFPQLVIAETFVAEDRETISRAVAEDT